VRLCRPEDAERELEIMVGHAEECLKRLGLAYRVVLLAAGDMGFSARANLRHRGVAAEPGPVPGDLVLFGLRPPSRPGARGIRMRARDGKTHVATLNGSGLPIGRTVLAILEAVPARGRGRRHPRRHSFPTPASPPSNRMDVPGT
jgi:seryl-tRNA synthetase